MDAALKINGYEQKWISSVEIQENYCYVVISPPEELNDKIENYWINLFNNYVESREFNKKANKFRLDIRTIDNVTTLYSCVVIGVELLDTGIKIKVYYRNKTTAS